MKEIRRAYTKVCMQLFSYLVWTITFKHAKDRLLFVLSERQKSTYKAMMAAANYLMDAEEDSARASMTRLY